MRGHMATSSGRVGNSVEAFNLLLPTLVLLVCLNVSS